MILRRCGVWGSYVRPLLHCIINLTHSGQNKLPPFYWWHFQMPFEVLISVKISLVFVPKGPVDNNRTLVEIMAWSWTVDKPLFAWKKRTISCIVNTMVIDEMTLQEARHHQPLNRPGCPGIWIYNTSTRSIKILTMWRCFVNQCCLKLLNWSLGIWVDHWESLSH